MFHCRRNKAVLNYCAQQFLITRLTHLEVSFITIIEKIVILLDEILKTAYLILDKSYTDLEKTNQIFLVLKINL